MNAVAKVFKEIKNDIHGKVVRLRVKDRPMCLWLWLC